MEIVDQPVYDITKVCMLEVNKFFLNRKRMSQIFALHLNATQLDKLNLKRKTKASESKQTDRKMALLQRKLEVIRFLVMAKTERELSLLQTKTILPELLKAQNVFISPSAKIHTCYNACYTVLSYE